MALYMIKYDGSVYANDELYIAAIAGGEKAFMKMLANKKVVSKKLFDQTLYQLTPSEQVMCKSHDPAVQDFEDFFKHLNIVSGDALNRLKEDGECPSLPNAALVTVSLNAIGSQYKYRQASFFRVRDFKQNRKYKMAAKLAAVKVCGFLYVALNAVDVRIGNPMIVTLKN